MVVDRRTAFVGGLDIAWCRWDCGAHPVTDPARRLFPQGADSYNGDVSDFAPPPVSEWRPDRWDRTKHARMGWHDVHAA